MAVAFVLMMELTLEARGFHPTIVDSQTQWEKQRARADSLGHRALVLVGDSRMQTDLDLDTFRARTELEPVELGIDGNSFVPIFAGLAHDDRVTGTLLVGFSDVEVMRWDSASASARYEADYENRDKPSAWPDYHSIEGFLEDRLHASLSSYADGASPLTSLLMRILDPGAKPQNVVTFPDRTRFVDYSRSDLRSLNYRSAIFELDGNAQGSFTTALADREQALESRIDSLRPADPAGYATRSAEIEALARAIEQRGGRVIFVVLPRTGYVRKIAARLYPRALFWDRFAEHCKACMHFEDDARLREIVPPDGLHLDGRDRIRFTDALIDALGIASGDSRVPGKSPADRRLPSGNSPAP